MTTIIAFPLPRRPTSHRKLQSHMACPNDGLASSLGPKKPTMAPTTVTIVGQLVKMAEPTEPTAFASFQRRSRRAF
jgi:hypothetical protein